MRRRDRILHNDVGLRDLVPISSSDQGDEKIQ